MMPVNATEYVHNEMMTTALEIPGYRIVRNVGLVRGITVRSRNLVSFICGAICVIFGGRNTVFVTLCEQARDEAAIILARNAAHMGANAVISCRYDATDIIGGVTEMIAYGTAVVVEPV